MQEMFANMRVQSPERERNLPLKGQNDIVNIEKTEDQLLHVNGVPRSVARINLLVLRDESRLTSLRSLILLFPRGGDASEPIILRARTVREVSARR
jgi:hypothetical protein